MLGLEARSAYLCGLSHAPGHAIQGEAMNTPTYTLYVVTVDGNEFSVFNDWVDSWGLAALYAREAAKNGGHYIPELKLFLPLHRISHWIWK